MRTSMLAVSFMASTALAGCATTSDFDKAIEMGATQLSQQELADAYPGNTAKNVEGRWTVYYRDDGTKLVKVGNELRERKWWVNDEGQWCETLYRDSSAFCAQTVTVQDGVYEVYRTNGRSVGKFRIEPGNSENM